MQEIKERFDREGIARGLRRGADYFYNAYCQSKGKPRWADKTPEYVRILPFVEEVFGPGCQYLMIHRHPFDVVNSLLSSGWDFSMEQWHCLTYHEDWYTNMLMYHADVLQRQLDFEAAHPDRCFRILYEKLVAEPEEVLRPAFEFLGESWEPQVLAHHEQQHDTGTEDPHASATKGFRPSVGNWKDWSKEQIDVAHEILAAQMEQLGYDAEP